MYINTDPCLIDYYNDREFLHTDGEENPAARVCTKACDLARRVLLFLLLSFCAAVGLLTVPPRSGWMDHRFREVSFGCPGR